MRPRFSRSRRLARGLGWASLLITAIGLASTCFTVWWQPSADFGGAGIGWGAVGMQVILRPIPLANPMPAPDTGLTLYGPHSPRLLWRPYWGGIAEWLLPLWAPALLCASAAVGFRLSDSLGLKRARAGRCPRCNYDLSGLAAGAACPECGAQPG